MYTQILSQSGKEKTMIEGVILSVVLDYAFLQRLPYFA